MSRSRIAFFVVSFILTFPMLAGTLLRAADRGDAVSDDDSLYKYLSVFTEVLGLVRQTYVDQADMDVLMAGALDGTTDALDPFSLYVPAKQVGGYLEARNVGWLHSGVILLKERGVAYVVAVEKGGPAGEAGLKPGDIVAKIGDRTTRQMPLWEMQEILAGKPGTKVSMELIRLGESVQASFVLAPFTPPRPGLEDVDGVTKLRIATFDGQTADQVRQLLAGAAERTRKGLLIDLRGVSSGDPEAAYATAKLFTTGELGILKRRAEEVQTFGADGPAAWQGRVVILVDRGTLGASEILATVLRQKVKAELVGERTFGYAGRQGMAELSTGGRLLYTEAFYTGPDKNPIREAIRPDLLVDERVRTYLEKDVPMTELILRRGVQRLLGEVQEAEQKAA